jgi:hypothetical protein
LFGEYGRREDQRMSGEIAKECKDGVSQKGSVGQNCGAIIIIL